MEKNIMTSSKMVFGWSRVNIIYHDYYSDLMQNMKCDS